MKGNDTSWGKGYAKEHTRVLPGKNSAAAAPSEGTTKCAGKVGSAEPNAGTKKVAGKPGSAEPCAGTTDCGGR
jgi:hypothetical protein